MKPFKDKLTEKQSKSLKKQIRQHLNKGFTQTNADTLAFQDISFYLQRYFIGALRSHDEYDSVLLSRQMKSIFRVEVKTYPQTGTIEYPKLQEVLENAAVQLQKSQNMMES